MAEKGEICRKCRAGKVPETSEATSARNRRRGRQSNLGARSADDRSGTQNRAAVH